LTGRLEVARSIFNPQNVAKLHKIAVLNAIDKTRLKNISPKNNTFVNSSGNFRLAENLVGIPLFQSPFT